MKNIEKKNMNTPLMQQYQDLKNQYPDSILLFRVGDFYETFAEDAIVTAKVLGITLTQRGNGVAQEVKLAGFPHHAVDVYLPKLVQAGHRVAICEQLEDPKDVKGLVKRGVTEIVTPGVAYSEQVLSTKENNFLAATFYDRKEAVGVAFLDISTGEFFAAQASLMQVQQWCAIFRPSELLYTPKQVEKCQSFFPNFPAYHLEDWAFGFDFTYRLLTEHFGTYSLQSFGLQNSPLAVRAAGAVLQYVKSIQNSPIRHLQKIQQIQPDAYMILDPFTVKNLEIFKSSQPLGTALIDVVDQTCSAMGGRKLKQWLALPLKNQEEIDERLNFTQFFFEEEELRLALRELLKQMPDLERLGGKLSAQKINPREFCTLKQALMLMQKIKKIIEPFEILQALHLRDAQLWIDQIQTCIHEDAPVQFQKGQVIAYGFSEELDELRKIIDSSKQYLERLQQQEIFNTQIPSLKIQFNQVFGYYFEVRHLHTSKVPEHWMRKQTLTNAERYITPELKEYETKILDAEDRILPLEKKIFQDLLDFFADEIIFIQHNAQLLSNLDVFLSFAQLSVEKRYTKPIFQEDFSLVLEEVRHPVIEACLPLGEEYIPNSVKLDQESQILLITGPNMGGKSAILRQTALTVLLAQIGCFVPAKSATLSVIDQIFTRVGAGDHLSQGESTFMVEMHEMAYILNHLSPRSLILLDEMGRGTSTQDGVALAWAITAYLHEHSFRPKTLFATHYHELNEMAQHFQRIRNFHVQVKVVSTGLIFLRRLKAGGSYHSLGLEVAKMAGIPLQIIEQARLLLPQLTEHIKITEPNPMVVLANQEMERAVLLQNKIKNIDLDELSPLAAFNFLQELKEYI